MEITLYKLENKSIDQVDEPINPENWREKIDWIDIRSNNRKEVVDYFRKLNLFSDLLEWIEHPQDYPFSNTSGNTVIINISISNAKDIYHADYVSLIIEDHLIFTIIPQDNALINDNTVSVYTEEKYPSLGNFLFNVLAAKILAQSNVNLGIARSRLQGIDNRLSTDPEKLSSEDMMSSERDISQLSDIIEDQYVSFEILASIITANLTKKDVQQTLVIIKGFEPLDKAMLRLEKKAESLRLQYMLYQQEKSTKKINVLTIIQAVFVPLTFIAGVYGMNFLNMPELEWTYSYLLVWVLFISLAGGLLIYFKRNGWFD